MLQSRPSKNPVFRTCIGLFTIAVFLTIGMGVMKTHPIVGGALIGLAGLRFLLGIVELVRLRQPNKED